MLASIRSRWAPTERDAGGQCTDPSDSRQSLQLPWAFTGFFLGSAAL
ncbi:MAG: hypothetical protein H6716_18185 [Polyangiaceae bacterium]|nr:hypothetical protein [Polyangiaceae bacterium]